MRNLSYLRRGLLAATALTLPALLAGGAALANPQGGTVVGGQAAISVPDPNTLRIDQGSQNAIINWQRFDIGQGEAVEIHQPSASSALLNRVTGSSEASRLLGRLTANGQVMLVNPNGVMIGPSAVIDVAALVATTADIPDAAFMAGSRAFSIPGNPGAAVTNAGAITVGEGGLVALVAPGVANSGVISARLGRIALASGDTFVIDFYGDGLVEVAADPAVLRTVLDADGNPLSAGVDNRGFLLADGGRIWLTAGAGAELLDRAVNVEGLVQADSVETRGGEIVLAASGAGAIEIGGTVQARGTRPGTAGGRVRASGGRVIQRGPVDVSGTDLGGRAEIHATGLAAIGNRVTADGGNGGQVEIRAGTLSSAGAVTARGIPGAGGSIDIAVAGSVIETASGSHDASGGGDGGRIRVTAGQQLTTSGSYRAEGETGSGGRIELSAAAVKLLSPRLSAVGASGGGLLRLGGEFQGGKDLVQDELPNAQTLVATDATLLAAGTTGLAGDGGTAIVWSDRETVFLGRIDVRPGIEAGAGGLAEISSGGLLTWRGEAATGRGDRRGQVLLDPKDIVIATAGYSQYGLILGYNYSDLLPQHELQAGDMFGTAVSLDGNRLAVGAPADDGVDDGTPDAGAVYLFTFADSAFTGGRLKAVVGKGYAGGANIDVADLGAADAFGQAVALQDTLLAVGAPFDDGASGSINDNFGAVYIFGFSDLDFSGGSLIGRLGVGYTGAADVDLALDAGDQFGYAVALDGDNMAIGAPGDAGANDDTPGAGAIYLFLNGGAAPLQKAVIGLDYAGGKDYSIPDLEAGDRFGTGIALDGALLAVGAPGNDGEGNPVTDAGAVYLITFLDTAYSGAALKGIVGHGYTSDNSISVSLDNGDKFGSSVAFGSLRLLVGAPGDDGYMSTGSSEYGAVYHFSFTDTTFGGGQLEGTAGRSYTGSSNIDLSLEMGDRFGAGLSLDDGRWAAGLPGNRGTLPVGTDAGAVMLFTAFPGSPVAVLGVGYAGPDDIDMSRQPASGDGFGAAVSLDGTRLAVGAPFDDGAGDMPGAADSGAVYLFAFDDAGFNGGTLQGVLGMGYVGGRNIDVFDLDPGDNFGASVSLDGTQLAVGAPGDDGASETITDAGAVYLFTFDDTLFSGGLLKQTIGRKANEVLSDDNVTELENDDKFGGDVSLNAGRLAVGAAGDDGAGNLASGAGAVYLFQLSGDLGTVTAIGTLGAGYTGGGNIDVPGLEAGDAFGAGVSLDGRRLAVGASAARGADNATSNVGAVHLFSFSDTTLASGSQVGIIGKGDYSAFGNSLDIPSLDADDYFGEGVSLRDNMLAIGAPLDDGAANTINNAGAVYLISFADESFSTPVLSARIGADYTGAYDVAVALSPGDMLGDSVSLNGARLAAGASFADGADGEAPQSGAVYLFDLTGGAVSSLGFADDPAGTVTISAVQLAALLATPQDVLLQASNDITLSLALTVANASGNGGSLTLMAGRSVLLNAPITTDNGDLTIIANAPLSAGVNDSQRDPGAATIAMTPGQAIDAGTGKVVLRLDAGSGKTEHESGDILLGDITAGHLQVVNAGTSPGSDIQPAGSTPAVTAGSASLEASGSIGASGFPLLLHVPVIEVKAGGNVWLSSQQAVTFGGATLGSLAGIETGGTFGFSGSGTLSQTEPMKVGGPAYLHAGTGSILLANADNDFHDQVAVTAGGDVALRDQNGLVLQGWSVSGSTTVTAGGTISQVNGVTLAGPASFSSGFGHILLNHPDNDLVGPIALYTGPGGNVALDGIDTIRLGTVNIGGSLWVGGLGPAILGGDVTAGGGIQLTAGIQTLAPLSLVSRGGGIALGPVSHGSHALTVEADTVELSGHWSGSGSRTLRPHDPGRSVHIATHAAPPDILHLSAEEIAYLEHDSPSLVTIGRNDGSGGLVGGTWSFDDSLALKGADIALGDATLSKSSGSLSLLATGAVTGAVNLAAGTGLLTVQGNSVQLSGTVNGLTGAAAAGQVVFIGTGGAGPYTMNGVTFYSTGLPADPVPDPGDSPAAPAPSSPGGGSGGQAVAGSGAPAGGLGAGEVEALEYSALMDTILNQNAMAEAVTGALAPQAEEEDEDDGSDPEGRDGQEDVSAPRSGRLVEFVDVDGAAASQDADDGSPGGAGCAC